MQSKKLTPLEILYKQKTGLQTKSDELGKSIENHAKYLHEHFVPLLRDSVVESAVSKMPPLLQSFAGSFLPKEQKANTQENRQNIQDSSIGKYFLEIVIGIVEIAPLFIKGKKGAILSLLLKQVFKWIRY